MRNEIIQETYNIKPVQFEEDQNIELSASNLYQLTLQEQRDGTIGQLQSNIQDLLAKIAQDDFLPNPSILQSLFETSYSYGFFIDKQGYDRKVLKVVEEVSQRIVQSEFNDSISISESGRICLPQNTVDDLVWYNQDPRRVAIITYLRGFCSGVIGRKENYFNFQGSLDNALSQIDMPRENLLVVRKVLLNEMLSQPDLLLEALFPQIEIIYSIGDLEYMINAIQKLLPNYINQRIKRIKEGKKKTKTLKEGKIVSFWSVEYEDPYQDIGQNLIQKDGKLNEREFKKLLFNTASKIGEIKLTRNVLERDLGKGIIPMDLTCLIDLFLVNNFALESDKANLYSQFCNFLLNLKKEINPDNEYVNKSKVTLEDPITLIQKDKEKVAEVAEVLQQFTLLNGEKISKEVLKIISSSLEENRYIEFLQFTCPRINAELLNSEYPSDYILTDEEGNNFETTKGRLSKLVQALNNIGIKSRVNIVIGDTDEEDYVFPIVGTPIFDVKDLEKRKISYKDNFYKSLKNNNSLNIVVYRWSEIRDLFTDSQPNMDLIISEKDLKEEVERMKEIFGVGNYYAGLEPPVEEDLYKIAELKFRSYAWQGYLLTSFLPNVILLQNEFPQKLRTKMINLLNITQGRCIPAIYPYRREDSPY